MMFDSNIPMIEVSFYLPHQRFSIGWQVLQPSSEYEYFTLELYLGFLTITYNNVR